MSAGARTHFRAHGRRRVDLRAVLRAGSLAYGVRIRNLGLGGACVEVGELITTPIPPRNELFAPPRFSDQRDPTSLPGAIELIQEGLAVVLNVTAPTMWDPLELPGETAWVGPIATPRALRAGIRFQHHDAAALYALTQLLSAHPDEG